MTSFETDIYCGLAVLVAAGFWFIRASHDPSEPKPPPKPKTRRDELIEARARIRRQIDILRNPMRASDYTWQTQDTLEQLQDTLRAIEDELGGARTGPLLGRGARVPD